MHQVQHVRRGRQLVRTLLLPSLIAVLLIPAVAATLTVTVDVNTAVKGSVDHLTVTDRPPQRISLTWLNSGSVGCEAQAFARFSNETHQNVYQAWSPATQLWPGDTASWNLVTALPPGTYNYSVLVDHCFNRFHTADGKIQSTNMTRHDTVTGVEHITRKDTVTIYLKTDSDRTAENVHVIPTAYPTGWRIPATKTTLQNDEITPVTVSYTPSIWKPANTTFTFVTDSGTVIGEQTIQLERQTGFVDMLHTTFTTVSLTLRTHLSTLI